jgi:DNA modification methylase
MFINQIIVFNNRGATTLMKNKHNNILVYGFNIAYNYVEDDESSSLKDRWKKYYDKDLKIYDSYYPEDDSIFVHASRSYLNRHKDADCLYQYNNKAIYDVWKINHAVNINYPTQKPFKLLERIICLSTR